MSSPALPSKFWLLFSYLTIVLLMSFKCIMDSVLSSVLGQVSVVLVFKACWLFPAHPMAVSPSAQPAGWGSGSTLSLWPLLPVFLLSQVSEYSDSFLLTSCTFLHLSATLSVALLLTCAAQ